MKFKSRSTGLIVPAIVLCALFGNASSAGAPTDYFQYVDLGGEGLTPVGYGYRSIEHLVRACHRVAESKDPQQTLLEIDHEAILATPANSRYNEQVIEAARQSILNAGETIPIRTTNEQRTTTNDEKTR